MTAGSSGVVLALAILATPCTGFAQPTAASAWGVSGAFAPEWSTPTWLTWLFDGGESSNVFGSEFRLGLVRGSPTGGDWGVSFVSKRFNDDSRVVDGGSTFCTSAGCVSPQTALEPRGARISGAEIHKYFNFGTIKRRAQIGLELAGGAGTMKGRALRTATDYRSEPAGTGPAWTETVTQEDLPATALFAEEVEYVPLVRFELGVGVVLSNALKVRVTGGFNFPGTQAVSVRAIYLFGGS
jgi:hypothetical protein